MNVSNNINKKVYSAPNSLPIIIDGVQYESCAHASRKLGISKSSMAKFRKELEKSGRKCIQRDVMIKKEVELSLP